MDKNPMMKCGHAANAIMNGKPVCAICAGITKDAEEIGTQPNLEGRKARCVYCRKECDSKTELPFFEYHPNNGKDSYYCGCMGWD